MICVRSLVPRPSPSSAPCALRVIIKCGGGKTEAEGLKNLSRDPRHRRHKVLSKMGMTLVAYWTYTYRADALVKRACTCIYLAAVFQVHAQHGTCRSTRTAWLSYGWLDKVYECVSIM